MSKDAKKHFDLQFLANLGNFLSISIVFSFVILFYLFNEEILRDYRLLLATFLLITGVSLLSWMSPTEDVEPTIKTNVNNLEIQ